MSKIIEWHNGIVLGEVFFDGEDEFAIDLDTLDEPVWDDED
jgi:hypothetical protein